MYSTLIVLLIQSPTPFFIPDLIGSSLACCRPRAFHRPPAIKSSHPTDTDPLRLYPYLSLHRIWTCFLVVAALLSVSSATEEEKALTLDHTHFTDVVSKLDFIVVESTHLDIELGITSQTGTRRQIADSAAVSSNRQPENIGCASRLEMERLKEVAPFVREALHNTFRVAQFFCFLHVSGNYLCDGIKLVGPSMLPTFNHGNIALVETVTRRLGKIGAGDIVVVRTPDEPQKVVAKRVKAVEGEKVSYLLDPNTSDENKTIVVPKGHVWVEGDNIYESRDSRQFGPVPYALLQSRIFLVVWPPKDFQLIGKKAS